MRTRFRIGVIGSLAALSLQASPAPAQVSEYNALCRNAIAKGVRKLADTVVKQLESCHQRRMVGILAEATDCNDPAHSPADPRVARAAARLVSLTQGSCAGSPAPNGYAYCPPPCDNVSITHYTSVANCLACLTQDYGRDAVSAGYGTPPVPPSPAELSCQKHIGKSLRKYAATRVQEQQRCQFAEDQAPTGLDCLTADPDGKIQRAFERAQATLERCAPDVLATLDSCGSGDLPAEQSCIASLAETYSDLLFDAVYRPPTPPATATPTDTATETSTPTITPLPTDTPTPSPSSTPVPTNTPLPPTATPTRTFTPPPLDINPTAFPALSGANAPCLIFVHGKQTNTGTYTDWNQARGYWTSGSDDFIRTATKNFASSYYVVGYNGSQAYWDVQSAGEVATEIVNATNGGNDGGGNHCAQSWANGGTFWVIAHSMGPSVVDFILGNSDPTDPNYNLNGPYDVATQRLSLVISIAGTHRGSQGADLVCGGGNPFCSFFAQFVQGCDDATYWIRTSDDVQVRAFASEPGRDVWLTGGYAAIIGASLCLNGEDDGLVQHAATYACDGNPTADMRNDSVCDNSHKMKPSGFHNLDTAHENHDEERNDSHADSRLAISTGVWRCNGSPCPQGQEVQGSMSTAELVRSLY